MEEGLTGEPLARLESHPLVLAATVEYSALRSGDPTAHDVMFVRIGPDRIDTPAATPGAALASYCTGHAELFEELTVLADPPVDALFDIDQILSWLEWLESEDEPVTATYLGDPETGVTERIVHETSDSEVVIPCETDWSYDEVSLSFPDRFADGVLHDEAGEPMPTRIDTEVEELERLVEATDLATADEGYEIIVEDEQLRVEARNPAGLSVSGELGATVSGPDLRTVVKPDLERVVSGLIGPVTLQTGPGQPLAIVQGTDEFTPRFVVDSA